MYRRSMMSGESATSRGDEKQVLILGSSGFIGSRVASFMSRTNADVVGFDSVPPRTDPANVTTIVGDVLDTKSVERTLGTFKFSSIIDLIGLPVVEECERNPEKSRLLNVQTLESLIEAMRDMGNVKLVFASSATVYGNTAIRPVKEDDTPAPASIYGRHKLMAEEYLRRSSLERGFPHAILRFFNVYGGPVSTGKDVLSILVRNALGNQPIRLKGKSKFRDFVWVDDVASIVSSFALGETSDGTINVGTGVKTTLAEVAGIVSDLIPGTRIMEESAPDDGTGIVADVTRLRSLVGGSPRHPRDGIKTYVQTALAEASNLIGSRAA